MSSYFEEVRAVSAKTTYALICHFVVVASALTIHTSWTSQNVDDRFGGALKPAHPKKDTNKWVRDRVFSGILSLHIDN